MKQQLKNYDELECPICEKVCKPDAIRKNGTVVYKTHNCNNGYEFVDVKRHFEINVDGELMGFN